MSLKNCKVFRNYVVIKYCSLPLRFSLEFSLDFFLVFRGVLSKQDLDVIRFYLPKALGNICDFLLVVLQR